MGKVVQALGSKVCKLIARCLYGFLVYQMQYRVTGILHSQANITRAIPTGHPSTRGTGTVWTWGLGGT